METVVDLPPELVRELAGELQASDEAFEEYVAAALRARLDAPDSATRDTDASAASDTGPSSKLDDHFHRPEQTEPEDDVEVTLGPGTGVPPCDPSDVAAIALDIDGGGGNPYCSRIVLEVD